MEKIIPIEKNIKRIRVEGHDVSMMCKSAEKSWDMVCKVAYS